MAGRAPGGLAVWVRARLLSESVFGPVIWVGCVRADVHGLGACALSCGWACGSVVVALVGAVMAVVVVAPVVRVVVVAMVGGDGGSRCVCVCVDRPSAARARGAWQERSAAHSSMRSESKHARSGNKLWS